MRLALPSAIAALAFAGRPAAALPRRAPLPRAQREDFRRPAGIRVADTLNAAFSIREVRWRPEGPTGADLSAFAFVEDGRLAKVPGPLLRAPAGTLMRVTLHNTLGVQIVVFGLQDHAPNKGPDSLTLAAGARASVSFRVTTAGTYYYWARLLLGAPAARRPTPHGAGAGRLAEWREGRGAVRGRAGGRRGRNGATARRTHPRRLLGTENFDTVVTARQPRCVRAKCTARCVDAAWRQGYDPSAFASLLFIARKTPLRNRSAGRPRSGSLIQRPHHARVVFQIATSTLASRSTSHA